FTLEQDRRIERGHVGEQRVEPPHRGAVPHERPEGLRFLLPWFMRLLTANVTKERCTDPDLGAVANRDLFEPGALHVAAVSGPHTAHEDTLPVTNDGEVMA